MAESSATPSHRRTEPWQDRLAARVRTHLRDREIRFDERLVDRDDESWYEFVLHTNPAHELHVALVVGWDGFAVVVNGADTRVEALDAGIERRWSDRAMHHLDALLDHDLKVRLRRRWGGERVGAVYVPAPGGGGWDGDWLARLGVGRVATYPEWIRRS